MALSFNEVKNITDTLPIGLYANRRIIAELGHDETSWYNPQEDVICISYEQVTQGLDKWQTEVETLIRSNFYHEVSHAILTPKEMSCDYIYNVFEDERIETLLKDFYYNVPIQRSNEIDLNPAIAEDKLSSPLSWYDPNNVNRKFVISEIDADYLATGITLTKASRA
jgi:hypothetical protein